MIAFGLVTWKEKNNMSPRRWVTAFFAGLLVLFGLGLFAAVELPYEKLKFLLGALTSDGSFNSLKAENFGIFKILFATGGLVFFALAALTGFRRWSVVAAFMRKLLADAGIFLRGLPPSKKEWGYLAAVLLITILAIIYRLEYICSSLHHDEAYTFMAFAHSLRTAITDYHLPNNHIFHSILLYFSTQLFGIQPWAVRLPAFIAGVLLVPAIYWLAKRIYNRWTGLAAALLVAFSPLLIGYSTNARGYSLVMLFSLLVFILGDFVRKEKNLFAWGLISLFSALGFYTIPVMMFSFGILFIWLFLENQFADLGPYRSKWEFVRYWLICGFSSAVLTLILYVPILVYSGPEKLFGNAFVSPALWEDVTDNFLYQMAGPWRVFIYQIPVIVAGVLTCGLVLSILLHKRLSKHHVLMQVAALVWLIVIVLVQRPKDGSKLWSFLVVLFILWAAAGIIGLLQMVRFKAVSLAPVAVCLVIGWGIWHAAWLAPQLPEIWKARGDTENAVMFVQNQLVEGDRLIVAPPDDAPVWYYAELHGMPTAAYYERYTTFNRLFVLVNSAEDQTPASVIEERGPDPASVDIDLARQLQVIGNIQVFEVPHK